MFNRKVLVNLSIFLILIGIACGAIPTDWKNTQQVITFIATLIGFVLAAISLAMPSSYSRMIDINEWKQQDKGYSYEMNRKKHGIGKNISFTVYQDDGNGNFNRITVGQDLNDKGDITLSVNNLPTSKYKIVVY